MWTPITPSSLGPRIINRLIMLNTDMAMVFEADYNHVIGGRTLGKPGTQCGVNEKSPFPLPAQDEDVTGCLLPRVDDQQSLSTGFTTITHPSFPLQDLAREFAGSSQVFLDAFAIAYTKMGRAGFAFKDLDRVVKTSAGGRRLSDKRNVILRSIDLNTCPP